MVKPIYKRWQEPIVASALKTRRIIVVEGPRQCGKTTLVKHLMSAKTIYYTLDDLALLASAESDAKGFVKHGNELMIIDEVQRMPSLLLAVKQDVDENQKPGRYLLTGSANIQSLPTVKESLAGRIRKIRLRPLAQGEIHKKPPQFISNAFDEKFDMVPNQSNLDKDSYITIALKGGYPEALEFDSEKDRRQWHSDYIHALMARDLKDIINIRRQDHMHKLIEVLAAWSSKLMDISAIGTNLSIVRSTIESYINALEALYLVERLRPWPRTDYDRVSKRDKIFMVDTGLMSSLLRWRFDKVRLNSDLNGKLIETFVFNQLSAVIDAEEEQCELYYYRDRDKHEIDFMIQNDDGDILGIEVKAGSVVDKESFKHLTWFKENIANDKRFIGIVLYTGSHVLSFGEQLWAVPISCLWA